MRLFIRILLGLLLADTAAATEKVSIGVEAINYLPYYSGEGAEYGGFMRELLDTFAGSQNIQIEYHALPVSRLFRDMIAGSVDIKAPDNPNWSAEEKKAAHLIYSNAVVNATEGVLVPTDKLAALKPEQIKMVGTIRGFTPYGLLDLIKAGKIEISENNDTAGLIESLLKGRVDGIYVSSLVARNTLVKLGGTGDELSLYRQLPIDEHPFMVSFQGKHGPLRKKFNDFLKTPGARKLYTKWKVSKDK